MKLSELSVRRAVTFTMLYALIIGFGIFSFARLKLDMYPEINFPMVLVITTYEGASPEDIEESITRPLEKSVATVEGIKKLSSTSKHGASLIFAEFSWGTDMDQAEYNVRKAIDFVKGYLPEDAGEPLSFALNPSMEPIAFLSVTGPYNQAELRDISENDVEPKIERIPGVASADTTGGLKREIQVRIIPQRLIAFQVNLNMLIQAIRLANLQLPSGTLDQGGRQFSILADAKFNSVDQIREVVVGYHGRYPVKLRDVAEVLDTYHEATELIRTDGKPGVTLMIRKQSDANTVQVANAVVRALPAIEERLPKGAKVNVLFEQGEIIRKSIGNLSGTSRQAFLLTFLVLLFFLQSFRPSIIVAMSIPVSVVAAFIVMDTLGLTLNIISMAGLALAIGMLVDNSIVVLESVYRHRQMGKPAAEAAITGTNEVGIAISASTLTTVAVFAPILFVPGIAGALFRDMSLTICASLMTSLFVALTLIPLAASRLLLHEQEQAKRSRPAEAAHAAVAWIGEFYSRALGWCLEHRKSTIFLALASFLLGLGLIAALPMNFFARSDIGQIALQVDESIGTSLEVTDKTFQELERLIAKSVPEAVHVSCDIGLGEGFMALFGKGSHSGMLRIKLSPLSQRTRKQVEIEEAVRQEFGKLPGVTAKVFQPSFLGQEGDIVVQLYGYDLDEARRIGREIKQLAENVEGTRDVTFSLQEGQPEYEVKLDRQRISALGLSAADVSSALSTYFQGKIASVYRDQGREYDILVRTVKDYRTDFTNLGAVSLTTPRGLQVPLASVASYERSVGPVAITRRDQQRMTTVAMTVPGKDLGGVVSRLEEKLRNYPWPREFSYSVGGTAEDLRESFMYLGWALLAAVFLVYMVMASQYESLLDPFIILFTIPLSVIGVALGLFVTRTPISVVALIGMIMLVGIVVNNAIVLLDYANQLHRAGLPLRQAISQAGSVRLRPVLMTALTTIFGMVPLALEIGEGAESWAPMARAVIGGLTTSTFLTLLVIPVLYVIFRGWAERFAERRVARQARRGLPAGVEQPTPQP